MCSTKSGHSVTLTEYKKVQEQWIIEEGLGRGIINALFAVALRLSKHQTNVTPNSEHLKHLIMLAWYGKEKPYHQRQPDIILNVYSCLILKRMLLNQTTKRHKLMYIWWNVVSMNFQLMRLADQLEWYKTSRSENHRTASMFSDRLLPRMIWMKPPLKIWNMHHNAHCRRFMFRMVCLFFLQNMCCKQFFYLKRLIPQENKYGWKVSYTKGKFSPWCKNPP